jgi:hypothetical protein
VNPQDELGALPLELFEDQRSKPRDGSNDSPTCQWCSTTLPTGAIYCPQCGSSVSVDHSLSIPGLTELTPEQELAARRPASTRSDAGIYGTDAPVGIIVAGVLLELTYNALKSRRMRKRRKDRDT